VNALKEYNKEVKSGAFPQQEHTYPMPEEEEKKFADFATSRLPQRPSN
jgi:hypothetical protein